MEGWESTRITRPDGTEIHVTSAGSASERIAFVLCDGIGCDGFVWRYLAPRLAERGRVVHPHYRGHGLSSYAGGAENDPANEKAYEPGAGDGYGIRTLAEDVLAAASAAGAERAVFFGHSMGVQVALEAALLAPERMLGLVLICGSYGRPLDTVNDRDTLKRVLPFARAVAQRFPGPVREIVSRVLPTELAWQIAQLVEVNGRLMNREDMLAYFEHMAKIDARVFLEMLDEAGKHTTETRLAEIAAPTLVVGGESDGFTPYWISEVMATRIPGAQLEMLRGGSHSAPLEQRELLEHRVLAFLDRAIPA